MAEYLEKLLFVLMGMVNLQVLLMQLFTLCSINMQTFLLIGLQYFVRHICLIFVSIQLKKNCSHKCVVYVYIYICIYFFGVKINFFKQFPAGLS